MQLGDYIDKNAKIWEIWTRSAKFWLFFLQKRDFLKITQVKIFFFKNEARKLKFGLGVPLYGI